MQYINDPSPPYTPVAGNGIIRAYGFVDVQALPPRIRSAMGGLELMVDGNWSIEAWRQPILDEIEARYGDNQLTRRKLTSYIDDLLSYLTSQGSIDLTDITDDQIIDWCDASSMHRTTGAIYDPAATTRRNRRWAARIALLIAQLLGVPIDAHSLTRGTVMVDDGKRKTRLLTDKQMRAVESHANPGVLPSYRSVIVALMRCGATPTECAAVTLGDVDLATGTVALGTNSTARVNRMCGWAHATISRRLRLRPPSSPAERLCVRPSTAPESAGTSIRNQLSHLMRQAGLAHIDGVSGTSIRYTAARLVFETHGIEAAARFLGTGSLDTAAAAVGHDWKTP